MKTIHFLACLSLIAITAKSFAAESAGEIPPPKDEPRIIEPGPPPSDAIVLFDGKDLSQWKDDKGGPAKWEGKDGGIHINGTGSIATKQEFGDCQLHVEWAKPREKKRKGEGGGGEQRKAVLTNKPKDNSPY